MSKSIFLALGVSVLCAMPILGSLGVQRDVPDRTARLSAPTQIVTTPIVTTPVTY